MTGENVEAVSRCLEGWNRGDYELWVSRAHPDVEYASAITRLTSGRDTAFRGLEEMRRFWEEWHSLWDLRIAITTTRALGEKVAALGSFTARGTASGVELSSPVGFVFEFEGGRFRRVMTYLDTREALDAAGLEE